MQKAFITLTVIVLALAAFSGAGFSFGGQGPGGGENPECVMGTLTLQEQETFIEIISDYQDLAEELKTKMRELKEKGDYEAFKEVKEEHRELMEKRLEELSKIIPEELKTRFENTGQNRHKSGWERGELNFKRQAGYRQVE